MRALRDDEPRTIGGYRLVGVIGAGGMGRVFLAVGPDGRLAAVKQVLSGLAENSEFRARFAREVEASRRVSGAYTAAVMDADPSTTAPWLASVYVPGPSLQEVVSESGPLPDASLRRLTVGLAVALAEIHRAGLVHRDLKPANVLLAQDGPRVIDFGIAQAAQETEQLTATGAVIGSPAYMSPEQIDGKTLTPASDMFALGSVLAFAATGTPPFGRGEPQGVIYRVLTGEPDISRVEPAGLRSIVGACLSREPHRRPTPQQLLASIGPLEPTHEWLPARTHAAITAQTRAAHDLAGTTRSGPVGPGPAAPTQVRPAATLPPVPVPVPAGGLPTPGNAPARSRSRWWIGGGVGVLAVVAVVVAAVLLWPRTGTPATTATGSTGGTVTAEQAAQLVRAVIPDRNRPPAGFSVVDDAQTPEVDGDATDPLKIDRSRTAFACDTQIDPPTPAEAGIVALTRSQFQESSGQRSDRFRDYDSFAVSWFDEASRTRITQEIRGRIGGCRTQLPVGFTAFRVSNNSIPGADENVGYIANQPAEDGFPQFPLRVGSCEFARVDAVVLRACALVSNTTLDDDPASAGALAQDDRLRAATRALLEPMVAQARSLQNG